MPLKVTISAKDSTHGNSVDIERSMLFSKDISEVSWTVNESGNN